MTFREEYLADLKTELERCNARIRGCSARRPADADATRRNEEELKRLRERRRDALSRLRRLERG